MTEKHIDILIEDVRVIRSDITDMKEVLVQNTETLKFNTNNLAEHMRRTELLEKSMETALLPIKAAKLVSQVVIGVAAVYGALKVLGIF